MIDLSPDQLAIVQSILEAHLPDVEVRAFGSRTKGTATAHSDLDLAIIAPLPVATLGELVEAFEESSLPFRVDIVVYPSASPNFQALIDDHYVTIVESS
jgi:uncharacterized protein